MSKWSQYISSWFGPPLVYSDAELRRRLSPPVYEKTYTEKLREIFGFVYSDERLKHKWGRRTGEPERRDFSVKVDTP
jgi:hypothetical protein